VAKVARGVQEASQLDTDTDFVDTQTPVEDSNREKN